MRSFLLKGQGLFLILVLSFAYVAFSLKQILMPFVVALVLSYLIVPSVAQIVKKTNIPRWTASLIMTTLATTVASVFIVVLVPFILKRTLRVLADVDLTALHKTLRLIIIDILQFILKESEPTTLKIVDEMLNQASLSAIEKIKDIVPQLVRSIMETFGSFSSLFFVPILMYHTTHKWPQMIAVLKTLLPKRYESLIVGIASDMDNGVSRCLLAQVKLCLILSVLYSTLLFFTPLKMSIGFGFVAGISSFIPYFGFLASTLSILLVSFADCGGNIYQMSIVFGALMVAQAIDIGFLTPKIMSRSLRINPVWFIFGVMAFTTLFGAIGAFFALPMVVIAVVIIKRLVALYKNTPMYYS